MASLHMSWPVINKGTPQHRPPLLLIPSSSPQPEFLPTEGGHVHVSCGSPFLVKSLSVCLPLYIRSVCSFCLVWEESMWCARATDQIKVRADMRIRYSAGLASCYYGHCVHIGCDAVQLCDFFFFYLPSCKNTHIELGWQWNQLGTSGLILPSIWKSSSVFLACFYSSLDQNSWIRRTFSANGCAPILKRNLPNSVANSLL